MFRRPVSMPVSCPIPSAAASRTTQPESRHWRRAADSVGGTGGRGGHKVLKRAQLADGNLVMFDKV
jgi:hypothetical protein